MQVFVTGSKGLIGSSLVPQLHSLGISVVELDLAWDKSDSRYGDILDKHKVLEAVKGCHGIVHLAAISRVIFGERNPELCWKTNVEGTQNIIDAAQDAPLKPWIIYASSREVYGQQPRLPVSEQDPVNPVNIYGQSKVAAEKALWAARSKGRAVAVLRFSNVYGSVQDHHDRVIPAFCRAAVRGDNLIVEGAQNLFDFTYIEDVVKGIVAAIRALVSGQNNLPPIHLTTGQATSLAMAATYAVQACQSHSKIVPGTPRSFDVATFCGDPSQARKLLGWEAAVHIQEGMRRLIHQFKIQESLISSHSSFLVAPL